MPKRISLREIRDADLETLFTFQNDPLAHEMAGFAPRGRDAFFAHWRNTVLPNPTGMSRCIEVDGKVAGHLVAWSEDERLLGYWLGREYWGQGIGSAAVREFLTIEKTRPIVGLVAVTNLGSIRVLEKNGFVRDATYDQIGPDNRPELRFVLLKSPG